jgi:preprotein translocase SecE subunit
MANAKKGKVEEGAVKAVKDRSDGSSKGSDSAASGTFVLFARVWIVLTGICLGVSCKYLVAGIEFFGKELLKMGSVSVTPGLLLGIAVGVLLILGLFRLFKGRLDWDLPSQGKWVRLTAYLFIMVLMVFGGFQLHAWPGMDSVWATTLASVGPFLGKTFELRPVFFPSLAVVLVTGLVSHFLFGGVTWRTFLIDTEAELKKVSWPDRPEWVGSSIVVLVVVSTMAIFLYLCDIGLSELMNEINAGF